jgi:hypothetical protein
MSKNNFLQLPKRISKIEQKLDSSEISYELMSSDANHKERK